MPVWNKASFDKFYRFSGESNGHWGGRPGIVLHYHEYSVGQYQRNRYAPLLFALLAANGLVAGDSIILVGGGFNWTGEGLERLGVDVLSTDISSYIQNEKGNTEESEIRQACLDAGVDPDTDKIYCKKSAPGAALTLDANRVAATVTWLTNPAEAESRMKWIQARSWDALSLEEKDAFKIQSGLGANAFWQWWTEQPESDVAALPSEAEVSSVPNEQLGNWQWSKDPLDVMLRGGRAAPQARGHGHILDEELRVKGSRNRVYNQIQTLGFADSRFIITEEVLNSITDAEGLLVCDYIEQFIAEHGGTCVHMISQLQSNDGFAAELNWKTYADWRTHLTANGFAGHLILPTVTVSGMAAYSGLI